MLPTKSICNNKRLKELVLQSESRQLILFIFIIKLDALTSTLTQERMENLKG